MMETFRLHFVSFKPTVPLLLICYGYELRTNVNTLKESRDVAFQGSQGIVPVNLKTYIFTCIFSILPRNEVSKTSTI